MEEKEQQLLTCYHCGNTGLMHIEGVYKTKCGGEVRDADGNIVDYDPVETIEWRLLSCPVCGDVTLYKEGMNEECGCIDLIEHCYPQIKEYGDAAVPEYIQRAFEAALEVKNIDAPLCLIALRRVLEAICKEKGADGNDLSKMIKDLVDKKILPEMLDDACWVIRQLGNCAAHADDIDFYKYEVERTTEFVGAIIDYLYILPSKISTFKLSVEKKIKN